MLVLSGCAQNAVLELTLVLPSPSAVGAPSAENAFVRFRSGDNPAEPTRGFALGADLELQIPLSSSTTSTTSTASVVIDDPARMTEPLWIQVQYCESPTCSSLADDMSARVAYVRIERGFYQGVYTSVQVELPSDAPWAGPMDPPTPLEIGKCDVAGEGCFEGTFSGNCRTLSGTETHVCE